MGILTDILKELPLSAVLREKLQELEKRYDQLEKENRKLKAENGSLRQSMDELTQRLSQLEHDSAPSKLSQVALAILDVYRQRDKTKLFKEAEIIQALNFGKIQIESAIDELKNTDMIRPTMISHDYGVLYSLTEKGKKYLI